MVVLLFSTNAPRAEFSELKQIWIPDQSQMLVGQIHSNLTQEMAKD